MKNEGNLVYICQPLSRTFTLQECNDLLPIIRRITEKWQQNIHKIMDDQRFYMKTGAPQIKVTDCDDRVSEEYRLWGTKLLRLGIKILEGNYLGFNSGFGYYSWAWNDPEVNHYHEYEEAPYQRRKLIRLNNVP